MEAFTAYLVLIVPAVLCGWGAHAASKAGYRAIAIVVFVLVILAGGIFLYAGSIATGHFLAGLGEVLIGFFLLLGPGLGLLLGVVTAGWRRIGLSLSGLYGLGLASFLFGLD